MNFYDEGFFEVFKTYYDEVLVFPDKELIYNTHRLGEWFNSKVLQYRKGDLDPILLEYFNKIDKEWYKKSKIVMKKKLPVKSYLEDILSYNQVKLLFLLISNGPMDLATLSKNNGQSKNDTLSLIKPIEAMELIRRFSFDGKEKFNHNLTKSEERVVVKMKSQV